MHSHQSVNVCLKRMRKEEGVMSPSHSLTLLQLLKERLELLVDAGVLHLDHLVHLLQVLVLEIGLGDLHL